MLVLRPQEVWLTFDFDPLCNLSGDCADFGGHDYSPHVAAYAKTYLLLEKHGLKAVHFPEKHLAAVSLQGKLLLQAAKDEIDRRRAERKTPAAHLELIDFRAAWQTPEAVAAAELAISPLRLRAPGGDWQPLPLKGKRLALAPACVLARQLLSHPELADAEVVGFFDRDAVLHGKQIDGVTVYPYAELARLAPDLVVVAVPEHHRRAIASTVSGQLGPNTKVAVFDGNFPDAPCAAKC